MDVRTIATGFLLAALWSMPGNTIAAGFGEGFKNFILGSEAKAALHAPGNTLDPISKACLSCHDGAQAKSISLNTSDVSPGRRFDRRNHPVGIEYDRAAVKDPHGLKSQAALHPAIQLVDGRVSCVSCHRQKSVQTASAGPITQLASQTCMSSKEYTLGPSDKELCLACHIK